MTNTFKRRIYRLSIVSAASFLAAFLLYDLGDVGIATDRLILPCAVLWLAGILLCFMAFYTWSGWYQDTSEDTNVGQKGRNAYPITFYTEAALMMLTVVFLLVFTLTRDQPTNAEGTVLAIILLVAGACIGMGHLSSNLE